ncbi:unnamed protein product [Gordionus sp. m RMFG-2023]
MKEDSNSTSSPAGYATDSFSNNMTIVYFEYVGNIIVSIFSIAYCGYLLLKFEEVTKSQIHVILNWLCFGDTVSNLCLLVKYGYEISVFLGQGNKSHEIIAPESTYVWLFFVYHIVSYLLKMFLRVIILHSLILCINLFLMILSNKEIYGTFTSKRINIFFLCSYIAYMIINIPYTFEYDIVPLTNYNAIHSKGLSESLSPSSFQVNENHSIIVAPSEKVDQVSFRSYTFCNDVLFFVIPALTMIILNVVSFVISRQGYNELNKKFNESLPSASNLKSKLHVSNGNLTANTTTTGPFSNSKMQKLHLYKLMSICLAGLHFVCLMPKVVLILVFENKLLAHKYRDDIKFQIFVTLSEILENIDSVPNFVLHFYSEKVFEAMIKEKRVKKNWNHVHTNINLRRAVALNKF